MVRIVILGSGRGSNAEAILNAQEAGQLGLAQVVGLFCDQPDALMLKLGPRFDVPAFYLHPGKFKTKLEGEAETHWIETIQRLQPDFIVLAGFMRVIKPPFIEAFKGRIINLHPSLLPKYPGLHSIQRAMEAGDAETGCTVHWVTPEIDAGEVLGQERVPIAKGDTLDEVEARVHAAEHRLLPATIRRLADELMLRH
ncbi:phosphoribosylglycinamide formyltransferase [Ruficoccus amylovorans]|uniref:Phosphoribosylglycinamide formyltransferase n=1 Tax=Ruficoccus amylovorans TaxID=1804625 RepID=A0A842HKW9_9BACT|nr:phosphoribosylglycinamide formyltransferase [Ruficoccus amylovorans]MBC2596324.1 phosphoribosylglycinamide formyltransferase [Ruficoccus amylovorans]